MKKRDRKALNSIINPIFVVVLILISVIILLSSIQFVRAPLLNATFVIGNDAPTQAWNLSIQIGSASILNWSTAANQLLYTHDFTPNINWTNGTDANGDQIDMFVCVKGVATDSACDFYGAWTNQSNLTSFAGLNHSGIFYVNITTNDGTINGTTYSTNFTINNTVPTISGSALLGNDTHDNTPGLNWSVVDPDNGGNYQWPADTQVDYIVIGDAAGEADNYNNTDGDANNNSEVTSALPWNATRDNWTSNRTYIVTVWAGDASENNGSSYSASLRLYDNLPNITQIWMADDGTLEDCSLAASTQCSLQAVSHNNVSNFIVQVNATDIDRDCDTSSSSATLYLCNKTSGACNENNYDFNFTLATITKDTDDTRNCSYAFPSAQGPAFTPQFFVPGSTAYLLQVNVSSQAGQAPGAIMTGENNATWYYKNVSSVNYTGSIIMGDGTINVNTWNPGTTIYNITNWGNVILNISWNITNMSGPAAQGWEMNGTDLEIDDDAVRDSDTGNLAAVGLNATNYTFVFGTGLDLCVAYDCNSPLKNESMETHWHIYPLAGIAAGTYYGNLTYRLFPR